MRTISRFLSSVELGNPVLIMDGEEPVGAKQNRIVNLTILVAAQSTVEIPVSCVEASRWGGRNRQGYSAKDSEFDLIYVNGGNNLENLETPDDRWKVRLIEEDFHHLMFDMEGA